MLHFAIVALLCVFAAAQQPQVQEQDLPKPGEAHTQQPAKPAQAQPEQKPVPESKPVEPTPSPSAAPEPVAAPPASPAPVGGQHVPAAEETERGQQGKPVAAFWTVIPGK